MEMNIIKTQNLQNRSCCFSFSVLYFSCPSYSDLLWIDGISLIANSDFDVVYKYCRGRYLKPYNVQN